MLGEPPPLPFPIERAPCYEVLIAVAFVTLHNLSISVLRVLPPTETFSATVAPLPLSLVREEGCHIFLRPHEGAARAFLAFIIALAFALPGLEESAELTDGSACEASPGSLGSPHLHVDVVSCVGRRHSSNGLFWELFGATVGRGGA